MKAVSIMIQDPDGRVMIGLPPGQKSDPVKEMAWLCEGIVLLIKSAHKDGVKNESDSMRDCIRHLNKGFVDETYRVEGTPKKRG